MSKKTSKFGAAFAAARKGGAKEFDFNGKKFNTKMKSDAPSKKSSLPKSAAVGPSRASAVSSMSKKPSFSALTEAGKGEKKYASGPSKRGGGPKIAMSQANLDKRKGSIGVKASASDTGFKASMKKVVNSFKKQSY